MMDEANLQLSQYASIKATSAFKYKVDNPKSIYTPRQMRLAPFGNPHICFLNSFNKRVSWRPLAYFSWRHLQGALPLNRKAKCVSDNESISHEHLFYKCSKHMRFMEEGKYWVKLFSPPLDTNKVTHFLQEYNNEEWSEVNNWRLWSWRYSHLVRAAQTIAWCTLLAIWLCHSDGIRKAKNQPSKPGEGVLRYIPDVVRRRDTTSIQLLIEQACNTELAWCRSLSKESNRVKARKEWQENWQIENRSIWLEKKHNAVHLKFPRLLE